MRSVPARVSTYPLLITIPPANPLRVFEPKCCGTTCPSLCDPVLLPRHTPRLLLLVAFQTGAKVAPHVWRSLESARTLTAPRQLYNACAESGQRISACAPRRADWLTARLSQVHTTQRPLSGARSDSSSLLRLLMLGIIFMKGLVTTLIASKYKVF